MGSAHEIISSPYMQILLVLGLSFLMGLEREEHKLQPGTYVAAGVRTFPIVALIGYMLIILSPDNLAPFSVGLLSVALFLLVSFWHKLSDGSRGFTSEMAALAAFIMGALIAKNEYWIAAAVAVADVLLLSAKKSLEGIARRLNPGELVTFVKFLILSAVILPIVPNYSFTQFQINPFKTWLIVVVVSGMSYASYLLQHGLRAKQSTLLSAFLGGAYSSTLTTVTLAKQSVGQDQPRLYSGGIVLASAVMYVRLGILIYVFNSSLGLYLAPTFGALAVVTAVTGLILMTCRTGSCSSSSGATIDRNPLELSTAFVFAGLFIVLSVATRLVSTYLGSSGVYALSAVMGMTDIDPFIMSLAQSGGEATGIATAALAVTIAAASNNLAKGIYAISFGGTRVGLPALIALGTVGIAGIVVVALMNLGVI